MGRARREIVERARREGLGKVVRLHREHRPAVALWLLVAVGSVVAGIATVILRFEENSPVWQWPVLAWGTLLALTLLWQHGVPVAGRRWYAVAERGLLIHSKETGPGRTVAMRWPDVRVRLTLGGSLPAVRLVHSVDGVEHERDVAEVNGRGDLIRAVRLRGRMPAWTARRVVGNGFLALLAVLVVWFAAVPLALHVVVGERPADLRHLARLCQGGPAFGRAAPYQGPGPHPLAVYDTLTSYPALTWGGQDGGHPEAHTVQLVACQRPAGRASAPPLKECRYSGGYEYVTYQGRYRVDVLEAGTGRQVTSFSLDGDPTPPGCQPSVLVPRDKPAGLTVHETTPDRAAYEPHLGQLVTGPVTPAQGS